MEMHDRPVRIFHTDGRNTDFINLCKQLDASLDELVGGAIQRDKYNKYNQLDKINDAVVLYIEGNPVAGGSFRFYQNSIAEIKRIFVKKEYRGWGLSRILMKELEAMALEAGYRKLVLETGNLLKASISLYKSIGFRITENYGPYKNMEESVCMEKALT